jgi:hypothetical protein
MWQKIFFVIFKVLISVTVKSAIFWNLGSVIRKLNYWKLKEEAQDRTLWRTQFGRGYWPVARQTNTWLELGRSLPTIRRNVLPSSSWPKGLPAFIYGNNLANGTMLHHVWMSTNTYVVPLQNVRSPSSMYKVGDDIFPYIFAFFKPSALWTGV